MAARTLMFLNCPAQLVLSRSLQCSRHWLKKCQYSSSKILNREEKPPVKFSTSSAAKITIAESLGLKKENSETKFRKFIILFSLGLFLLYFCVLREENEFDELLSGKSQIKSDELELIDLKIKLLYCEKNNLPTRNLKDRIEEIVSRNQKPIFKK